MSKRLDDIHSLREITERINQGDVETVLDLIAERAVELTEAKHGGVWLVNKTKTALEFGGRATKEQHEDFPPDIPLDASSENSFSKWVSLNRFLFVWQR